jgi:hypothetical protein
VVQKIATKESKERKGDVILHQIILLKKSVPVRAYLRFKKLATKRYKQISRRKDFKVWFLSDLAT